MTVAVRGYDSVAPASAPAAEQVTELETRRRPHASRGTNVPRRRPARGARPLACHHGIGKNARVTTDQDPIGEIIATARKAARYPRVDRITDAQLERRLHAFAKPYAGGPDDGEFRGRLAIEAGRLVRDALVTTLVKDHALEEVAAGACRRAGIPGSEPQVAYCLVMLCQKQDPVRSINGSLRRTYALDVGDEGFGEQLLHWADVISANVRDCGEDHRAIVDEAEDFEITTLRGFVRRFTSRDDVIDVLADRLSATLTGGPALEDMTLATARTDEPHGGDYVFQSHLGQWIETTVKRVLAREPSRSANDADISVLPSASAPLGSGEEHHDELVRLVAALRPTRKLLADASGLAELALDRSASRSLEADEASEQLQRVRSELVFIADGLRDERRLFGQMLAYVVLGFAQAPNRHAVAILSLRADWLEEAVRRDIAQRMRSVVEGDDQPVPALVVKAEDASTRGRIPRDRLRELRRLRQDLPYRASEFVRIQTILDVLPAVVGSSSKEIAAAAPDQLVQGSVRAARYQAAKELGAVDPVFERAFRRYTQRPAKGKVTSVGRV